MSTPNLVVRPVFSLEIFLCILGTYVDDVSSDVTVMSSTRGRAFHAWRDLSLRVRVTLKQRTPHLNMTVTALERYLHHNEEASNQPQRSPYAPSSIANEESGSRTS